MNSKLILFLLIFVLSACNSSVTYTLQTEFDEHQAIAALGKGKNAISGEAFLRKNNGNIVTCAGLEVLLVPETIYAQERMTFIYGNTTKGFNPVSRCVSFMPNNPQYQIAQQRTLCSSTGHFEFNNIKDGTYFVIAPVSWGSPTGKKQGGALMEKISVKGGKKHKMIMTL